MWLCRVAEPRPPRRAHACRPAWPAHAAGPRLPAHACRPTPAGPRLPAHACRPNDPCLPALTCRPLLAGPCLPALACRPLLADPRSDPAASDAPRDSYGRSGCRPACVIARAEHGSSARCGPATSESAQQVRTSALVVRACKSCQKRTAPPPRRRPRAAAPPRRAAAPPPRDGPGYRGISPMSPASRFSNT